MSMMDIVLWIIYPYTVIAIFIMGLVWQYDFAVIKSVNSPKMKTKSLNRAIQLITVFVILVGLIIPVSFTNDIEKMFEWILSIILFNPNIDAIIHTSIIIKAHLLAFFTLFLLLPFSSYIQLFSKPIHSISSLFHKKDYTFGDMYNEKYMVSTAVETKRHAE